jgi:hypothetical protein
VRAAQPALQHAHLEASSAHGDEVELHLLACGTAASGTSTASARSTWGTRWARMRRRLLLLLLHRVCAGAQRQRIVLPQPWQGGAKGAWRPLRCVGGAARESGLCCWRSRRRLLMLLLCCARWPHIVQVRAVGARACRRCCRAGC